jgi:hypothetical protein
MDRDLLSAVLGRRVWPHSLAPAVLHGHRRSAVRGASYPVVLRNRRASVAGVIFDCVGTAERDRLCAYEGDRYELVRARASEPERAVLLFTPKPGAYTVTPKPWTLAGWRLRHKRSAIEAVTVGWVEQNAKPTANCPTGELMGFAALSPSYRRSDER